MLRKVAVAKPISKSAYVRTGRTSARSHRTRPRAHAGHCRRGYWKDDASSPSALPTWFVKVMPGPTKFLPLPIRRTRPRRCASGCRKSCAGRISPACASRPFTSTATSLLRENGREFGVLDDQDLWIYLRRRLRELNLSYFVRAASVSKFLEDLLKFMRHCHDELVTPERYQEYVQQLERGELPIPRVTKSKDADDSVRRRSTGTMPRNCQRVFHSGTHVEGRQPGYVRAHDHPCLPLTPAG